jgi:hypothetical protein
MTESVMVLTGAIVLTVTVSATAVKPLDDYSFIRGVCHPGGWRADEATVRKERGYARRLQLNSTRIWRSPRSYQGNREDFVGKLRSYVRIAHGLGLSTMPILFKGNSLNPHTLPPESWPQQEAYVKAVVEALKDEPGVLMWDIMNEPSWNDYHNQASEEERPQRVAEIKAFLAHFAKYVKSLDPVNATTIGHTFAKDIEWFRDAKFGIWAHWGPQCQPERGDWYAREMYSEGNRRYQEHVARFGHPSTYGFKDVIHAWKAENWDPDKLPALYQRAGAPDSDETAVVEGLAKWMEVNQEAIHGTRPWKVFGEGPQMASAAPIRAQGFNEGRGRPFTAEDVRFTMKGDTLYGIVMGAPDTAVSIKSLGENAKLSERPISEITLLGSDEKLKWSQTADALVIETPQNQPSDVAIVFKIIPKG